MCTRGYHGDELSYGSVFPQVAFQGTVVTIENFLAWKASFDLEVSELRKKRQKEEEQGSKAKLTGRTPRWSVAMATDS